MEQKYLIIGGSVTSRSDGDRHYITASKLCGLYGLKMSECWFAEDAYPYSRDNLLKSLAKRIESGDVKILRPRYDGNYKL